MGEHKSLLFKLYIDIDSYLCWVLKSGINQGGYIHLESRILFSLWWPCASEEELL